MSLLWQVWVFKEFIQWKTIQGSDIYRLIYLFIYLLRRECNFYMGQNDHDGHFAHLEIGITLFSNEWSYV